MKNKKLFGLNNEAAYLYSIAMSDRKVMDGEMSSNLLKVSLSLEEEFSKLKEPKDPAEQQIYHMSLALTLAAGRIAQRGLERHNDQPFPFTYDVKTGEVADGADSYGEEIPIPPGEFMKSLSN